VSTGLFVLPARAGAPPASSIATTTMQRRYRARASRSSGFPGGEFVFIGFPIWF
jgi:hypothetical protein